MLDLDLDDYQIVFTVMVLLLMVVSVARLVLASICCSSHWILFLKVTWIRYWEPSSLRIVLVAVVTRFLEKKVLANHWGQILITAHEDTPH